MPATGPRPNSPVDQDLQRLYNEVWAGFESEKPNPPSRDELEGLYGDYLGGRDSPLTHPVNKTLPTNHQQYYAQEGLPPTPVHQANSSKNSGVRRLPPTPGSSSSSPTTPISMPIPEPYYDSNSPQRPAHYTADSYATTISSTSTSSSTDLLKKATTGSANGRRLPQAPSGGGYPNGSQPATNGRPSPLPGLPADPRPTSSPTSPHPSLSRGGGSYSASSGGPPYRPPGALPPAVPGYQENTPSVGQALSSSGFDIYNMDNRNVSNGHLHQQQQPYRQQHQQYQPQQQHAYSKSLNAPPYPPQNPSRENLAASEYVVPDSRYDSNKYETYNTASNGVGASVGRNRSYQSSIYQPSTYQPSTMSYVPDADYGSAVTTPSTDYKDAASYPNPYDTSQSTLPPESRFPIQEAYYEEDMPAGGVLRRPTDMLKTLADFKHDEPLGLHDNVVAAGEDGEYWEDEEEEDENRFVNISLLSHMAVQLRDKVPRGTHVKGNIPYPRAFTGKDIVSTIQSRIQRDLAINHGISTNDRRIALQVARSLQSQLFFYEVEWGGRVLQDGVEDVYMFLDDVEGTSDAVPEREELPTGVITVLTRCYSPSCTDESPCYCFACPRKGTTIAALPPPTDIISSTKLEEWEETVDQGILNALSEEEIRRQNIIHKIIMKEEQYIKDLDIVESVFIKPLRLANPPVMPPEMLEDFIDDVFGNILDLRECNRRLLEVMYVRQREQGPVIERIGDIFLDAATEFRLAYPTYIGHHPIGEKRMKDEVENNPKFKLFLEQCARESSRQGETIRLDLKHFLNRPSEHLQKYPVMLEAVANDTGEHHPDKEFLKEAVEAIKNLYGVAQLLTFQSAMGKGAPGKFEWHDLVAPEIRETFTKKEAKRQAIIFELIKGEMAYVKDLENIETMYVQPLRAADPPIIAPQRLDQFIDDVFHNFTELYTHHRRLVNKLHEIQREEHPKIRSIVAPLFDTALNFRDAYMEYIPNYPIAAYRIDDEMATNPAFKAFVDQCVRHPDAHRLDMKNFINRPIPRLLRYELLLKGIIEETEEPHDDLDTIPQVIDIIKALGKETEPGVFSAKQKVELWRYNSNLVFKNGEFIDMDLLDEQRTLVYSGRLLRQPESGLEWNGWSELHVLLFDNYLVMTKPKERDGVLKYYVNRRPIPLDLLTLVNFTDPPTQRSTGILRNLRGERAHENSNVPSPENPNDSRSVYPLTLHHNGRTGGPYILYAESSQARTDWKSKLEEALGLRRVVQDSNKVFEPETLSSDTFLVPSITATQTPAWNQDITYTGKVTCSVPFNTADGRALVAIGCAEGVWIGFRHDPKSMRRVLHLKMVTQCAMLEDFGIFLVLADKSLFAYHIEALVPSSPHASHTSQIPQKLNGTKDVHFFSVGQLHGRTLIIYMKKKGLDSIFRVLEPVGDKINERVKAPVGFGSRLGFRSAKSEWFRIYRDFFLPSESFDLIFLKARIAILCAKGFEIMDLNDFNSVTIPMREDPRLASLAKRCESCRPMGMFRSAEDEFLLVYDEFGVYVDKHGDPSRSAGTIEWEGTAERVAFHSPYILLFDTRFIEIRHIESGRLAQIIPGNDVRCIWDGRGVSSNAATTPSADGSVQEAQVHAVMNSTDTVSGARSRAIAQHVVELIPTVPLNLPERHGNNQPHRVLSVQSVQSSQSLPHSPGLQRNSAGSWRS